MMILSAFLVGFPALVAALNATDGNYTVAVPVALAMAGLAPCVVRARRLVGPVAGGACAYTLAGLIMCLNTATLVGIAVLCWLLKKEADVKIAWAVFVGVGVGILVAVAGGDVFASVILGNLAGVYTLITPGAEVLGHRIR